MSVIRPLSSSDRPAFIAIMADAFCNDPLIAATLGTRPDLLAPFLSFMFDMTRTMGGRRLGLEQDGRLVGCMLIEPPTRNGPASWMQTLLVGLRFIPLAARLPRSSTALLNRYMVQTRAAAPAARHAYLSMVGVASSCQGQGFGRRLIEAAIIEAKAMSTEGLALDTENPLNVPLYEKLGFNLTARLDLGAFTSFCMYRPAQ